MSLGILFSTIPTTITSSDSLLVIVRYDILEVILSKNKLADSTHWRHMRELVFNPLMDFEGIDSHDYDMYNVKCFDSLGAELQGYNVSCVTANGFSPFVYSDEYDNYLVPKKTNSKSYNGIEGDFLLFSHDKTYDYYLMADFIYKIDKAKSLEVTFLTSSVKIVPWGYYNISVEDYGHKGTFQKFKVGTKCTNGATGRKNQEFDPQGGMLRAFGFSRATLLSQVTGSSSHSPKKYLKGGKPVQKYHKNYKNKQSHKGRKPHRPR